MRVYDDVRVLSPVVKGQIGASDVFQPLHLDCETARECRTRHPRGADSSPGQELLFVRGRKKDLRVNLSVSIDTVAGLAGHPRETAGLHSSRNQRSPGSGRRTSVVPSAECPSCVSWHAFAR